MLLEQALETGFALFCPRAVAWWTCGIVPEERTDHMREMQWRMQDETAAETDVELPQEDIFDRDAFRTERCDLVLRVLPWPPVSVWVGAMLALMLEKGETLGILRCEETDIVVQRTEKSDAAIRAALAGKRRIPNVRTCARCPFMDCCRETGAFEEEDEAYWKTQQK